MKAVIIPEDTLEELVKECLKELEFDKMRFEAGKMSHAAYDDRAKVSSMHRIFHFHVARLADKIRNAKL